MRINAIHQRESATYTLDFMKKEIASVILSIKSMWSSLGHEEHTGFLL